MSTWAIAFVLSCCCLAAAHAQVRIRALYESSQLTVGSLFIRGNALGLNWTSGARMQASPAARGEWTIDLAAPAAPEAFEFKVLVDDAQWQLGANEFALVAAAAPVTLTVAPWFVLPVGAYSGAVRRHGFQSILYLQELRIL
jgi:hypothetical protein